MPEVFSFSTIPAKILLPIDFSSSSHEALEQATVLAQHFHAEIYLVHVVPETGNVEEAKKQAEADFALSVAGLAVKGVKAKSSVNFLMESKDCSRSHGHPPGALSRAMIVTACSNNAAARAGSVAISASAACAGRLSDGTSMPLQFTPPDSQSPAPHKRSAVPKRNS